ncbi:hypothetical protein B0H13DRAFT_1919503 [Mycena leptocephala]|nr:hypothetical protein B0H13DRAFT_1919503 [Mycena leptocephala]
MALNQVLPQLLEYHPTTQTYRTFSGMELNRGIQTYLFNSFGHSSISITETLVFEALEHFKHFDDPDLKCRGYDVLSGYYQRNFDISTAKEFCETSITLALSTQNTKRQSYALATLAWFSWCSGDYFTAQLHTKEAQSCSQHPFEILQETSVDQDLFLWQCFAQYLYLREANFLLAKTLFESCLKPSFTPPEIMSYCLERLGNTSCWGAPNWMSGWTTVFLVHSVQRQEKLGIYKALQFLGDAFLAQDDEHTAINLFTVALEGFTYMDVHCSRAECMLQLGDISNGTVTY